MTTLIPKAEPDPIRSKVILTVVPCHSRKIPLWMVLLDNIPTLVLFILGFLIISQISFYGGIAYIFYSLFSVVWFWLKICPSCHHYDSLSCPCGYGAISPKFTRKRSDKSFKKVFRNNIWVMVPDWLVPFVIAIVIALTRHTSEILILTISFSIVGFIVIPVISKQVGCKNCEIR